MKRRRTRKEKEAIDDLIAHGQEGEARATPWLTDHGFKIIKDYKHPHTDFYDKIAREKNGRKWMIEIKAELRRKRAGVRGGTPRVTIKNLVRMATEGRREENVQEVGLLFMPRKGPPLLFRLEGGTEGYARSYAAWQANVRRKK